MPITVSGELRVLWFVHISKTGGDTAVQYLQARTRPRRPASPWLLVDLYNNVSSRKLGKGRWPVCPSALRNASMDAWGQA